jgi:hypothetical protein
LLAIAKDAGFEFDVKDLNESSVGMPPVDPNLASQAIAKVKAETRDLDDTDKSLKPDTAKNIASTITTSTTTTSLPPPPPIFAAGVNNSLVPSTVHSVGASQSAPFAVPLAALAFDPATGLPLPLPQTATYAVASSFGNPGAPLGPQYLTPPPVSVTEGYTFVGGSSPSQSSSGVTVQTLPDGRTVITMPAPGTLPRNNGTSEIPTMTSASSTFSNTTTTSTTTSVDDDEPSSYYSKTIEEKSTLDNTVPSAPSNISSDPTVSGSSIDDLRARLASLRTSHSNERNGGI